MTAVLFRPPASLVERLEWAKTQIGVAHRDACVRLLVEAGWPLEAVGARVVAHALSVPRPASSHRFTGLHV